MPLKVLDQIRDASEDDKISASAYVTKVLKSHFGMQ